MSKRNKILLTVGLLVVVAAAGYYSHSRDIAPIDDSDLDLPEPPTADGENPYREIRTWSFTDEQRSRIGEARNMISDPDIVADWDVIDELLTEFSDELKALDRCAGQSGWSLEEKISLDTPFPELTAINTLATLRRIQIASQLEKGEPQQALQHALELLRFGRELQQVHGGGLIHALVGFTTAGMGQRELSKIIASTPLKDAQLSNLANQVLELRGGADTMKNALKVEYRTMSDLLPKIASGELDLEKMRQIDEGGEIEEKSPGPFRRPSPLFFKPNATHQLFAETYRSAIRSLDGYAIDAPQNLVEKEIVEIRSSRAKLWMSGNAIGIILNTMIAPAIERMAVICAVHRSNQDLLILQIAMQRYRLAEGNWPAGLGELVPDFIDAIPIDQVDGQPLRYNPDTRKIYSIGTDFIDSEGETRLNRDGPFDDRDESAIPLEPR